jgi:NADH-quinone oxidoreductase subunit C
MTAPFAPGAGGGRDLAEALPGAREVPAEQWRAAVAAARDDGYDYFDWLGCVDEIGRSDTFRVVLMLRRSPSYEVLVLTTRVSRDDPRLDSIGEEFLGAGWHERESAELFGIEFVGGDRRRLLLGPDASAAPLRKDEVLAARTVAPWPGAKEPGETDASPSRRRMVPPGVPQPEVWGDRDPAVPAPTPAEVADSAVGGRVRRGKR